MDDDWGYPHDLGNHQTWEKTWKKCWNRWNWTWILKLPCPIRFNPTWYPQIICQNPCQSHLFQLPQSSTCYKKWPYVVSSCGQKQRQKKSPSPHMTIVHSQCHLSPLHPLIVRSYRMYVDMQYPTMCIIHTRMCMCIYIYIHTFVCMYIYICT